MKMTKTDMTLEPAGKLANRNEALDVLQNAPECRPGDLIDIGNIY